MTYTHTDILCTIVHVPVYLIITKKKKKKKKKKNSLSSKIKLTSSIKGPNDTPNILTTIKPKAINLVMENDLQ